MFRLALAACFVVHALFCGPVTIAPDHAEDVGGCLLAGVKQPRCRNNPRYPGSVPMMTRRTLLLTPLAAQSARPKVAVVMNVYFPNSHADVFVGRLLGGYRLNHVSHRPRVQAVSFYVDQFPFNDMAREQAEEFGVAIYPDVAGALRRGAAKLSVDGVAIVGEHGNYPKNARGNFTYPRFKRFEEVARVMKDDGRIVPVFFDKYFASEWEDARRIYDRVREMKIPLFSGSSLPLTWRRPELEFARGIELDEVLAVSFSDLEEHAYHAVELMQAMAERRKGSETGVASIRCVEGEEVWKLDWSKDLLHQALSRRVNPGYGKESGNPQAIQIRYRDGLKATVLNLDGMTRDYLFAARERNGRTHSSCFYIQLYNHNHWSFMVRAFEDLVLAKKTPHPIERNLLTTGLTIFALESRLQGGKWLDTPQLGISY
ncbi:MAG: hypothetical protein JJE04_22960 [Acidobacteriia bacterium]|nr:hypothetical protein [Terriglobia bacterium]